MLKKRNYSNITEAEEDAYTTEWQPPRFFTQMPFSVVQEIRKYYNQQLAMINPAGSIRDLPGPLPSFDAMRFPSALQKFMYKCHGEIQKPTGFQSQAAPLLLSGHSLIAYGHCFGKTLLYCSSILLKIWHNLENSQNWTILVSSKE